MILFFMLRISDTDIVARLRVDNPWWSGPIDQTLSPYNFRRRAYYEALKRLIARPINRAVILLGARRVGKTTLIRQLIGEVSASGEVGPILFASVDTPTYSGLPLQKFLDFFESECPHDSSASRLIVFDEIQYLSDWERHLKELVDRYPATKFLASGSAGAALKRKSDESGAGRFTDFSLPPLTFAEFLVFRDLEEELIFEEQVDDGRLQYRTTDIEKLNRNFIDYVNFGGYPEVVVAPELQADITRTVGRDIVDKVLLRDLPSLYGIQNIPELNRLFTMLAFNTGQEVSLDALSQNSGVAKNTIGRYLEYLETAFLIFRVRRIDDSARHFKRQRGFKVYLTNPSMRAALFGPVLDGERAMGALAETAAFCQWLHSPDIRNLHYARWRDGEVDVVRLDPATMKPSWAYDVKWSDRPKDRPDELRSLVGLAHRTGLKLVGVSTRTVSTTSTIDGVEIHLFPLALQCYRLGRQLASEAGILRRFDLLDG